MKKLIPILKKINESSIDFPSEDLPKDIWEKQEDTYTLKPELKTKILDALSQYPNLDLLDIADKIHIVGSIGTNLNDEDADIDVHIMPKSGKLPNTDLEELQRDVMNWFKNNREENNWYVNKHPFEIFLQLNPTQDYYSDTVYDLLNDKWEKAFKKYDLNYNPYDVYSSVFSILQNLTAPADIAIGELRRDTMDYNRLIKAIKKAPNEVKKELKLTLERKLDEIEFDIEELIKNKEIWRNVRHSPSISSDDVIEDINKLSQSEDWKKGNAVFKLIDRYAYFILINNLKKLIDNKEITDNDIPEIERILKEFNSKL